MRNQLIRIKLSHNPLLCRTLRSGGVMNNAIELSNAGWVLINSGGRNPSSQRN